MHANFKCPTSEPTLFYGGGGCMFVATMTICRGKWFFSCFFLVSQGRLATIVAPSFVFNFSSIFDARSLIKLFSSNGVYR